MRPPKSCVLPVSRYAAVTWLIVWLLLGLRDRMKLMLLNTFSASPRNSKLSRTVIAHALDHAHVESDERRAGDEVIARRAVAGDDLDAVRPAGRREIAAGRRPERAVAGRRRGARAERLDRVVDDVLRQHVDPLLASSKRSLYTSCSSSSVIPDEAHVAEARATRRSARCPPIELPPADQLVDRARAHYCRSGGRGRKAAGRPS